MVGSKIQTNLMGVETIQNDAVGKVLDLSYTSEEACIFNLLFLKTLDSHSCMVEQGPSGPWV